MKLAYIKELVYAEEEGAILFKLLSSHLATHSSDNDQKVGCLPA